MDASISCLIYHSFIDLFLQVYADVASAENDVAILERDEYFTCYYSLSEDNPRLEKPPLSAYLAKGIGIVATGIMVLLGGLALELYLVISIWKQHVTVSKIAKNTITSTTPVKSEESCVLVF